MDKKITAIMDEVTIGLNCLEAKVETKEQVKDRIRTALEKAEIDRPARSLEEVPIKVLDLLRERLGIAFLVEDGKIVGYYKDGGNYYADEEERRRQWISGEVE
ncbi:hypothetical protein [Harryflintia acetispora]|uniref:hypothetical protein n=1 Tax=Harryflintia acetispora TaxID=1849041 RepID=UPI00189A67F1|nr:hypothetical protein [Harryflintia acetispora]